MYDFQLDDPALATWVLLARTRAALYKVEERKIAKMGLTPEQVHVLWLCNGYPIPLTPAEISRAMFRESQTIAGLISRMEKEGLVMRVPKRKGHPFTEVKITARGEEVRGPGVETTTTLIARIMSCLSVEEHEQLQRLLRKLRQSALEELHLELLQPPSKAGG